MKHFTITQFTPSDTNQSENVCCYNVADSERFHFWVRDVCEKLPLNFCTKRKKQSPTPTTIVFGYYSLYNEMK